MIQKMNKITIFIILIVFISVAIQAQQGKMRKKAIDRNYNPATVETLTGAITDISDVNTWGLHIKIKTDRGITGVHLGPQWYFKDKITLSSGDTVTVTGSRVNINGEVVIVAKTVSKDKVSVQLRDENGIPLWAGKGKNKKR